MPLDAKPFEPADKIKKRVYYGKPNIFADVDINQVTDIDEEGFNQASEALGGLTTNFAPVHTVVAWTGSSLQFSLTLSTPGKLYYNKIAFDIPAFDLQFVTGQLGAINTSGGFGDGVVNVWLIATKTVTNFGVDTSIAGVNGPGFISPLPSSDAIQYSSERIAYTIGKNTPVSILGTDEEVITLLCQNAFKFKLDQPGAELPYLLINTPDKSKLDGILGVGFPLSYATNVKGVIGNLLKAFNNLGSAALHLFAGDTDDFIYFPLPNLPVATNFTTEVFNRIRNFAHTFLKVVSFKSNTTVTAFDSGSGLLTIPDDGNVHTITLTSLSVIKDLKVYDYTNAVAYYPEDGTILYLTYSVTGGVGNTALRFNPTDVDSKFVCGIHTGTPADLTTAGSQTMTVVLERKAGYWWVVAYDTSIAIASINSFIGLLSIGLSQEIDDRTAADVVLQDNIQAVADNLADEVIRAEGVENTINEGWTNVNPPVAVTHVNPSGGAISVTSGNIGFKRIGKTMFATWLFRGTISGTPNYININLPSGWVLKNAAANVVTYTGTDAYLYAECAAGDTAIKLWRQNHAVNDIPDDDLYFGGMFTAELQ